MNAKGPFLGNRAYTIIAMRQARRRLKYQALLVGGRFESAVEVVRRDALLRLRRRQTGRRPARRCTLADVLPRARRCVQPGASWPRGGEAEGG